MKLSDNILIIFILILILAIITISYRYNVETFSSTVLETDVDINHPEFDARDQARIVSGEDVGAESHGRGRGREQDQDQERQNGNDEDIDLNNYVRKNDIERAARASAREYCPVGPEYNPSDFVRKSEIDFQNQCPKTPDLKDFVLKSTIPPVQKCPSCVCPKVKINAGMCKKCPEPKNNCPKPEACGMEQCKDIVQCGPGNKPHSCPKCPAPEACPIPPERVCPAFEIPKSNIKCPSPQPCSTPQPCPNGDGRCPEQQKSQCKYYGVKDIVHEKPVNEIVNELMLSDDPKLKELLDNLKKKLDLNLTASPTERVIPVKETTSSQITAPTSQKAPTTQITAATTMASESLDVDKYNMVVPTQPPSNSLPEYRVNNNTNYGYDVYSYSIYNGGMYNNQDIPQPSVNSNIQVNVLDEQHSNQNKVCDINDTACPYNTNINM